LYSHQEKHTVIFQVHACIQVTTCSQSHLRLHFTSTTCSFLVGGTGGADCMGTTFKTSSGLAAKVLGCEWAEELEGASSFVWYALRVRLSAPLPVLSSSASPVASPSDGVEWVGECEASSSLARRSPKVMEEESGGPCDPH
jgi:hypothetical protein